MVKCPHCSRELEEIKEPVKIAVQIESFEEREREAHDDLIKSVNNISK